jgi:hypothetical protein
LVTSKNHISQMSFGEMSEYLLLFPVARAWLALALPCMEDAPKGL